jgi:hypothetical protein
MTPPVMHDVKIGGAASAAETANLEETTKMWGAKFPLTSPAGDFRLRM